MNRSLAVIGITLGFAAAAAHADTIADWTFETNTPASSTGAVAGPIAADVGTGTASGSHTSASTAYSSPAGNGSAHSFSSNTWTTGDYYQFSVDAQGDTGLSLSFDQISSSTGPKDFALYYSTNGSAYTEVGSYSVLANSGSTVWSSSTAVAASHYSYDLSSIAALNNSSNVSFRLVDVDTTAANGGSVATAGTDRVDNIVVSANTAPVPLPAGIWLFGSGIAALAIKRRRRS